LPNGIGFGGCVPPQALSTNQLLSLLVEWGVVLQGGPSLNPLADAEAGAGRELNESHSGAIDLIAVVVVRERLREDILAGGKKTTALGFTCRLSSS